MSNLVVDSCVVAKWFLPESDSAQARKLFVDAMVRGDRLIVLDLALAEISNVIWKHFRAGRLTADEARAHLVDLKAVSVHLEPFSKYLDTALEIAMQYDRAVYDALFVALTIDLGASAVTADAPLFNVLGAAYPQIKLLRDWP